MANNLFFNILANDRTGRIFAGIASDLRSVGGAVGDAQKQLSAFGRDAARFGSAASLAITAPVVGAGVSVIRVAADFEAAMNRVGAVTGASGSQITALAAAARHLGETTSFSASQAASGIEMLAKNGLDAQQILGGALKGALLLSSATNSELASAADLATDVLAQFGMQADQFTGAVDTIVGATNTSKFGFEDFADALANAGGVAGAVGVDFGDFATALAATSSAFSSGADAGTSFKTFLQTLTPKSAAAEAAMRALGLEFFDAQNNLRPMGAIFQELQDALQGLNVSGAVQLAVVEDLRALEGLDLSARADGIARIRDELANIEGGQGLIDLMAGLETVSGDAFSGQIERISKSLDGLPDREKIEYISEIFGTDAMRTAFSAAQMGAEGFERVAQGIASVSAQDQAEARMQGLNGAIKQLSSAFEGLQLAIADTGLLDLVTGLTGKITEIVRAASGADAALLRVGTAVAIAAATIGPVVAAGGAFAMFLGALSAPVVGLIAVAGATVGALVVFRDEIGGAFSRGLGSARGAVRSFQEQFPNLTAVLSGVVDFIGGSFSVSIEDARAMFEGFGGFIKDLFGGVGKVVTGTFTLIDRVLGGDLKGAVGGVVDMVEGMVILINTVLDALTLGMVTRGGEITAGFVTGLAGLLTDPVGVFQDMLAHVRAEIDAAVTWVADSGLDMGTRLVDGLLAGIAGGVTRIKDSVTGLAGNMIGWFKDKTGIRSPSRVFAGMGGDLMRGLVIGVDRGTPQVRTAVDGVVDDITAPLAGVQQTMDDIGAALVSDLGGALSNGQTEFDNFGRAMNAIGHRMRTNLINGAITPITDSLAQMVSGLFTGAGASGGGGFGSVVSSLFAGFFATGGTIPAGQFGIVGERGPELAFAGSGPMQIMPLGGGMTGGSAPVLPGHGAAPGAVQSGGITVHQGDIIVNGGADRDMLRQIQRAQQRQADETIAILERRRSQGLA